MIHLLLYVTISFHYYYYYYAHAHTRSSSLYAWSNVCGIHPETHTHTHVYLHWVRDDRGRCVFFQLYITRQTGLICMQIHCSTCPIFKGVIRWNIFFSLRFLLRFSLELSIFLVFLSNVRIICTKLMCVRERLCCAPAFSVLEVCFCRTSFRF